MTETGSMTKKMEKPPTLSRIQIITDSIITITITREITTMMRIRLKMMKIRSGARVLKAIMLMFIPVILSEAFVMEPEHAFLQMGLHIRDNGKMI